ncbi:diguanylate cyclase domain-containing protein [Paenibacillus sp. MBLB4367]|uniref:diguanylate cyclase domain-containing protein n=1 Tax=Paenibacillus sp. MBLB4367 TaxID=3384767 RepID=UPI003907FB8F
MQRYGDAPMETVMEAIGGDRLFRSVVETAYDFLAVFDPQGRQLATSPTKGNACAGLFPGWDHIEAHAEEGDKRKLLHTLAEVLMDGTPRQLEFRCFLPSGNRWFESVAVRVPESRTRPAYVLMALKDITERKRMEEEHMRLAFHDSLTGLPNRMLFQEQLAHALAQAKRNHDGLALFYIDIDNFKNINDTMGHPVGDAYLRSFAERVKTCLREGDTFSRIGGDEFTVLLPGIDTVDIADKVLLRIFDALQNNWDVCGHSYEPTISVGVAFYPDHGSKASTLLKHSDLALYGVKGSGRNGYRVFDPGLFR